MFVFLCTSRESYQKHSFVSITDTLVFLAYTFKGTSIETLRRNPLKNRAISSFSRQKSGTRIILSIVQSFLHFLKAKYISKHIISSHSFHRYFQMFHTKFNIRFRHLVLLEMICFEKIFKAVVHKFPIRCK